MKQIDTPKIHKEDIERLIPDIHTGRAFYYEHLVRYLFASQFVKGKIVLDLGCGTGYGSQILLNNGIAKKVIGIDISKEALNYAKKHFKSNQLIFKQDDIRTLKKIANKSIDIVVCFEVIEHITNQEKLLSQVKRVLKQNGIFIVSTPNKLISLNDNPFHVKELYPDEFQSLLNKYFSYIDILYQRKTFKDVIRKISEKKNFSTDLNVSTETNYNSIFDIKNSQYLIAVCSQYQIPNIKLTSLDTLVIDNLDITQGISSLSQQIEEKELELQRIYNSTTWKMLWWYKKFSKIPFTFIQKVFPLWLRKKIRSEITKYIHPYPESKLSRGIQINWKSWKESRSNDGYDMLNFGIISFDYRIQRPQQLALNLTEYLNRVFYIENEFSTFSQVKNVNTPIIASQKSRNVFKINPLASRELFIYRDIPSTEDINIIKISIKRLLNEAEIINPIAKIDHPFWAKVIRELEIPYVYDCMDEHSGFNENGKIINELESELLLNSVGVIVSSKVLEEKCRKKTINNILSLRNAGEFKHFIGAGKHEFNPPSELIDINHPIIGYYGAISSWFDTSILEQLASDYPNISIILIGRIDNSKVKKLGKKYRNIHLLGEKPYAELPAYLQQFDVCVIPFIINDLIKATDPVKIYEYFAAGKPVVTTAIPQLEEYKDILYLSKNPQEFSKNIRIALKEDNLKLKQKRIAIAKANTWENRAEVLDKWLKKLLFPKVSIIIVSYNNPDLINKCLTSVLKRSFYPNFEVIIVDNASNNETIAVLDSYTEDSRIKLIKNKRNLGFAAGNNIGLHEAKGDYLILLNNDTMVTPGWISRLVHYAKKDKVGLVGPVTNSIGNEARVNLKYNPEKLDELENNAAEYTYTHWGETMEVENIAAFCWIMSKNTYKKIGDFDDRFGKGLFEDDDYCLRVREAGLKILIADDVFVHHWGGGTTKWGTEEYKKLFEQNKKIFEHKWKIKWTSHKYR